MEKKREKRKKKTNCNCQRITVRADEEQIPVAGTKQHENQLLFYEQKQHEEEEDAGIRPVGGRENTGAKIKINKEKDGRTSLLSLFVAVRYCVGPA